MTGGAAGFRIVWCVVESPNVRNEYHDCCCWLAITVLTSAQAGMVAVVMIVGVSVVCKTSAIE